MITATHRGTVLPVQFDGRRTAADVRIAVCWSNSRCGRAALRRAAELAWLAGTDLLVHTSDEAGPDAELAAELAEFPVLPRITRTAADPLAGPSWTDLLVLGRRGDRPGLGPDEQVLDVADRAVAAVLVVGDQPQPAAHRIAVLLDAADAVCSATDRAALRAGAELAALHRARLDVLHAIPPTGPRPVRPAWDAHADLLADAAATAQRHAPAVRVNTALVRATPLEVAADPGAADVLVLGVGDHLDPVAMAGLHHARQPVLLARDRPEQPPPSGPDRSR
jgi:hypothetical protein